MAGRGFAVFETALGGCGIVWSDAGIAGVQLPEAREIDTRARLYRRFPDARDTPPPAYASLAIAGIARLLRGGAADLADIPLDMAGQSYFSQRVYAHVRTIPRGETRSTEQVAASLRIAGAVFSVAQALSKNPFMILVPCHRVLPSHGQPDGLSAHAGVISRRRLLSIEGSSPGRGRTLFDALLSAPPRAPG